MNALQDFQNAQDSFAAAQAQLVAAKASLELARLNLSYTKVIAPVDGLVTNMNTSDGTFVTAGNQLMALVDTDSFWVACYFKETQLAHIEVGQKANLTFMGYPNQPFEGVVRSVGWGVYVQDGSGNASTGLLPSISQTVDWVRLPQRFAARIQVAGRPPVPLRIGQTVYVSMTPMVERTEAPQNPCDSRTRTKKASTKEEKARLVALIGALQTLATRTTVLVSRKHILPEIAQAILRPRFECLELEFKQMLDGFAKCLRQGDCRRELPSLHRALGEMEGALDTIHQREIFNGQQLEAPVRVLELMDHYQATGEVLEECRRLIGTLKIHRYWGHCGL